MKREVDTNVSEQGVRFCCPCYRSVQGMSRRSESKTNITCLKVKVKVVYFMSITRDSNTTDILEVDDALILPPISINAPF